MSTYYILYDVHKELYNIAETVIIDDRLSFADQGKQNFSVFRFRLQQTNGSLLFPFSVCSKQTEVAVFPLAQFTVIRNSRNMETWTWGHGVIDT